MKFAEQKEFKQAKPEEVIKHLRKVKRETIKVNPLSLILKTGSGPDAEKIHLMVSDGHTRFYDVRKSFLFKLLKWYSFPTYLLNRLSTETVVSAANDFLLNMKSNEVFIKLENEEALTITSSRYTDLPDLEILEMCKDMKIKSVTRNDFFMSMNSDDVYKVQPRKGDNCGFGFNIANSETGFHSLQVSHYILRYICSNGAMVQINKEKQKPLIHYNISRDYALNYIKESVKEVEKTRETIFNRLKGLTESVTEKEMISTKRKLSGILGYQESAKLMEQYKKNTEYNTEEFDGSQYSLFNFITSKAKSYDIYRRIQLEHLAGNIFLS